jgi:hypothetical protein
VEDLHNATILIHPLADRDRRVNQRTHAGAIRDGMPNERETPKQIQVIQQRRAETSVVFGKFAQE